MKIPATIFQKAFNFFKKLTIRKQSPLAYFFRRRLGDKKASRFSLAFLGLTWPFPKGGQSFLRPLAIFFCGGKQWPNSTHWTK
ncbi:MAG: hypothetical protein LBO66_07345 [Deltaproteobacteria bacterium]|nr:hypothetical protein [Deltaproteobacteria bacterium]